MSKIAIYLNFQGNTAAAFDFYKSVFGTEFSSPMMYIKDLPPNPNGPKFSESDLNCVMHVALPIVGGTEIMGTDMLESMGHKLIVGNNTVMIPLNCNYYSWASEVGDNMASVAQISYWNNINQYFVAATNFGDFWDGDFPVSIAMPLMVNAYSSFSWPSAPPSKSHLTPRASK